MCRHALIPSSSYTRTGCFQSCLCLQRLVLDGCGIKTTLHENKNNLCGVGEKEVEEKVEEEEEEEEEEEAKSEVDALEDRHIMHLLQSSSAGTDASRRTDFTASTPDSCHMAANELPTLSQLRKRAMQLSVFAGLTQLRELSLSGACCSVDPVRGVRRNDASVCNRFPSLFCFA